jgi:hypothetical protein
MIHSYYVLSCINIELTIHHKYIIAICICGRKIMKIIFHSVKVKWLYEQNLNGKTLKSKGKPSNL